MSEQNAQEIVGTLINVEKVVVSGKPQSGDQDARWEHAVCRPAEGGITGAHTVHILTLLKERGRHMEDSPDVYAAVFEEVVTDSSRPSDIAMALLCRSGGKVKLKIDYAGEVPIAGAPDAKLRIPLLALEAIDEDDY
ncbi:MAG: hypothetical protein HY986_09505 [Candidatus Melainabacteria bacterium]|nr:hypothetical protein [Candidatus Melainabacteria bacterium]